MSVFRMHIQKIDKPKCFMCGNSVNMISNAAESTVDCYF